MRLRSFAISRISVFSGSLFQLRMISQVKMLMSSMSCCNSPGVRSPFEAACVASAAQVLALWANVEMLFRMSTVTMLVISSICATGVMV